LQVCRLDFQIIRIEEGRFAEQLTPFDLLFLFHTVGEVNVVGSLRDGDRLVLGVVTGHARLACVRAMDVALLQGVRALMNVVAPVAQLIVSLATFALIRHQVSVAVAQIVQAEHGEARLLQLAFAVYALDESLNARVPAESRRYRKAQDVGRVTGIAAFEVDGPAAAGNGASHDRQDKA